MLEIPLGDNSRPQSPLVSPLVSDRKRGLAYRLRKATASAHDVVEREPIVDALITGLIPRDVHLKYLICLYYVYSTLENALQEHSSHPLLTRINNPAGLSRADNLEQDIRYFAGLEHDQEWRHKADRKGKGRAKYDDRLSTRTDQALNAYVSRLTTLSSSTTSTSAASSLCLFPPSTIVDPVLLAAHAYVRYMGDLSGGQSIRKSVVAAYLLPLDALDGQRYYNFGRENSVAEIKDLKHAFRHGLDVIGADLTSEQQEAMLAEANHAFELNIRLFSAFSDELADPVREIEKLSAAVCPYRRDKVDGGPIQHTSQTRAAVAILVLALAMFWRIWSS